jgi:hypothetical protein
MSRIDHDFYAPNSAMNVDSKKRCSFVTSLFAAGYGEQLAYKEQGNR